MGKFLGQRSDLQYPLVGITRASGEWRGLRERIGASHRCRLHDSQENTGG